eukprot:8896942-Alexandrium_andersonii.AAC.1
MRAMTAELGFRLWSGKPQSRTSRDTAGCCVRSWLLQASSNRRPSATGRPALSNGRSNQRSIR